jgi:hypothetical protein
MGGGMRSGGWNGGRGSGIGRPGWGNNFRQRGWNSGFNNRNYGGFGGYGGWGYSSFYPDYGFGDNYADYGQPQAPAVYLLPPPEPEAPPPPPPPPAYPVMHEYSWPNSPNSTALFSIVSKAGAVREVSSVWVQGNQVRYTSEGGTTGSIAYASVDCTATNRLNRLNQQQLSLPGCAPSK